MNEELGIPAHPGGISDFGFRISDFRPPTLQARHPLNDRLSEYSEPATTLFFCRRSAAFRLFLIVNVGRQPAKAAARLIKRGAVMSAGGATDD